MLSDTYNAPELHFYPRPPRGGRRRALVAGADTERFLSTPSARRATLKTAFPARLFSYFYPRPPRGGRPARGQAPRASCPISIHALREEGDSRH